MSSGGTLREVHLLDSLITSKWGNNVAEAVSGVCGAMKLYHIPLFFIR